MLFDGIACIGTNKYSAHLLHLADVTYKSALSQASANLARGWIINHEKKHINQMIV